MTEKEVLEMLISKLQDIAPYRALLWPPDNAIILTHPDHVPWMVKVVSLKENDDESPAE